MPIDMRTLLLLLALFWFGPLAARPAPMAVSAPDHASECPNAKRAAARTVRPKTKTAHQVGGGLSAGSTLFSRRAPEIYP
jgi:hypothetical protein